MSASLGAGTLIHTHTIAGVRARWGGRREISAMTPAISVVTLVSDQSLYAASRATLEEQMPSRIEWIPVDANGRGWDAPTGLNHGLAGASARWVVCAHQDVLYPDGWWKRVEDQLIGWRGKVGVVGLVGMKRSGAFRGHVLDPHSHCRWGPLPDRVISVDEHVIILDGRRGLRFDPAIGGFHCYGTDISLQAIDRGLDVVVVDAPVVHLSGGRCDDSFDRCAERLRAKWGGRFGGVIPTCAKIIRDERRRLDWRYQIMRLVRRRSIRLRACTCGAFGTRGAGA